MPNSTQLGLGLLAGLALSGILAVVAGIVISLAAGLLLLLVLDFALITGVYVLIRRSAKAGN